MNPLTLEEVVQAAQVRPLTALQPCSVRGVSIDSRRINKGDLFIAIKGAQHDGHDFVEHALEAGALYAMVADTECCRDPELKSRLIAVPDTRAALGHIAAHYREQLAATVIAVTGSNGKTTTKSMIHHVLAGSTRGYCGIKSYNNDIGVPLTLLAAGYADDYLIVEVGTNAAGEISSLGALIKPDIAVVTNVGPAHLEGLKSIAGVAEEKLSLLAHLRQRGTAVLNADSSEIRHRLRDLEHATQVTFGEHHSADLRVTDWCVNEASMSFRINDRYQVHLALLGRHNASNALAAFAVARRMGLDPEDICTRLSSFSLPDMRLQLRNCGSMTVINDSYNANPGSMSAALEVLQSVKTPGRRVAIVGDMLELGQHAESYHRQLGQLIARSEVDVLLSIGDYAELVCQSAVDTGRGRLLAHHSKSVGQLVPVLGDWLQPDDTILLKGSRAMRLEVLLEAIPPG